MLIANELPRVFLFTENDEEIELDDANPDFTPEDILNFYSATYPILTTAKVQGPFIENDKLQYRFVSTMGTKG